jgi:CHC2 zinc finger
MQINGDHFGKNGLDYLLSQLSRVKQTGADRYIACCPSHKDKNPSLAIRDSNGTILLRCFAGCSAYEIVSAVGMELSDLFPKSDKYLKPVKNPFPTTDVLRCIQSEALLVVVIASKLSKGVMLSKSDKQRLLVAVGRIGACYE